MLKRNSASDAQREVMVNILDKTVASSNDGHALPEENLAEQVAAMMEAGLSHPTEAVCYWLIDVGYRIPTRWRRCSGRRTGRRAETSSPPSPARSTAGAGWRSPTTPTRSGGVRRWNHHPGQGRLQSADGAGIGVGLRHRLVAESPSNKSASRPSSCASTAPAATGSPPT